MLAGHVGRLAGKDRQDSQAKQAAAATAPERSLQGLAEGRDDLRHDNSQHLQGWQPVAAATRVLGVKTCAPTVTPPPESLHRPIQPMPRPPSCHSAPLPPVPCPGAACRLAAQLLHSTCLHQLRLGGHELFLGDGWDGLPAVRPEGAPAAGQGAEGSKREVGGPASRLSRQAGGVERCSTRQ